MDFERLSARLAAKGIKEPALNFSNGLIVSFHGLHEVAKAIEPAQRKDFEEILIEASSGIDDLRHWGWGFLTSYDMACLAHVASCYDKKHGAHDREGLTFKLCDGRVAESPNPNRVLEIRRRNLPEYLLDHPDEAKLRCCADLMLAVAGIRELEHVFSPDQYIKYFNVVDGLARLESMEEYTAKKLYAFGVLAAEKESKFGKIRNRLRNHIQYTEQYIAEEIALPNGAILIGEYREKNDIYFSVLRSNKYKLYPHDYSWDGARHHRLDGSARILGDAGSHEKSFETIDALFKWATSEEQGALYAAFIRIFAKMNQSPGAAARFQPDRQSRLLSEYWATKHGQANELNRPATKGVLASIDCSGPR